MAVHFRERNDDIFGSISLRQRKTYLNSPHSPLQGASITFVFFFFFSYKTSGTCFKNMILQGKLTGGKNDLSPHVSHSLPMLCDFVEEVNVFLWAFVVIRALTRVIIVMCLGQESDHFIYQKEKIKRENLFVFGWEGDGERGF